MRVRVLLVISYPRASLTGGFRFEFVGVEIFPINGRDEQTQRTDRSCSFDV